MMFSSLIFSGLNDIWFAHGGQDRRGVIIYLVSIIQKKASTEVEAFNLMYLIKRFDT